MAALLTSWYATPSGSVGRRLTEILAAEWQSVLNRSCKSGITLVFAHVILTKMLGVRMAREIRERFKRSMDLWEIGIHTGLVGNVERYGSVREGRAAIGGEEEYKSM